MLDCDRARQKNVVKLKAQRNIAKRASITRPNACNPYGPTSVLEIAVILFFRSLHDVKRELLSNL